MKTKYLGVPVWGWGVALLIGVAVFFYFRHSNTARASAGADETDSVQTDATPTTTASLGGSPPTDSMGDLSWLAALLEQQNQSLSELSANYGALTGSGVYTGYGYPSGYSDPGNPYTGQFSVSTPAPSPGASDPRAPLTPGQAGYGYGYGPGGSYVVPGFSTYGDGTVIPPSAVITPQFATQTPTPTVGKNVAV